MWETCYICGEVYTDGPPPFYCDECQKIVDVCVDALREARQVGVPRYGPSSWRDIPIQQHLVHASIHLEDFIHSIAAPSFHPEDSEDHLSHAICRLAMARALTDG